MTSDANSPARPQPRPVIYITNGSIGDFLMALHFADLVSARVHIITPRDAKLFRELADQYDVMVTECNACSLRGLINCLATALSALRPTAVVSPLPFTSLPRGTRMFARALSSFPGSSFTGLDMNDGRTLYPDMMSALAGKLGFAAEHEPSPVKAHSETRAPQLRFTHDQTNLERSGLVAGEYVVIHPCGSNAIRTLSSEEIEAIIQVIREKQPSLKVAFTGSRKDRVHIEAALTRLAKGAVGSSGYIVDLAGILSMNELENVLAASRLYIGVDTGVTHIACMLGVQSLVVAHAASLLQWLPYYNANARIMYAIKDCPHGMNEGFEHIKECYDEGSRYLIHVPIEAVLKVLSGML